MEDHVQVVDAAAPPNIRYKIRVYANVEGLTKAYRDANVLHDDKNLTSFIQGFNKADTLCDIVDAGNGKECADVKLKGQSLIFVILQCGSSGIHQAKDTKLRYFKICRSFRAGYRRRSLFASRLLCLC